MTKTVYRNTQNVGIGVAAWLAFDEYDYNDDPNYYSATTLLRPLRQTLLAKQLPEDVIKEVDIMSLINSRVGTAVHDKIEYVWKEHYREALTALGYKKRVIDLVRINPTKEELEENPDIIPVYMERRVTKKIGEFTVGGKFDFCIEGNLTDFKTTKAYKYISGASDEDYRLQGSIYKWLEPDIITEPSMTIDYVFMDWKEHEFKRDPHNYPPTPTLSKKFDLYDPYEIEQWVRDRLQTIKRLSSAPQSEFPECTDEELWRSPTVFKYYKNPANAEKGGRSTKNFDNYPDALERKNADKNVGTIIEVKGEVKACKWCAVCSICEQKDRYIADGSLKL